MMWDANLEHLRAAYESGKNPLTYIPYADALRQAGALKQALEVCTAGLENDSYSVTGRTLLAKILYDMGRYDRAVEELGTVLQVAPDAYGANLMMAKTLAKRREFHEAVDIINSIKAQNPSDPELLAVDNILRSQIAAIETAGDFYEEGAGASVKTPVPLDERIKDLRRHLGNFPGLAQFNFSRLRQPSKPQARPGGVKGRDLDPHNAIFLNLNGILKDKGQGQLKRLTMEMTKGDLLMYRVEGFLLFIATEPGVNLGRLRFQIEAFLRS